PDPSPQGRVPAHRILAEHASRAAIRGAVPLDDLDRRRLAGTVRSEQRDDLPGPDHEVHPVEDHASAIGLPEAGDLDHELGGLAPGRIVAYWNSKRSAVTSPTWIARRTPSASMKYVCGRATTRYALRIAPSGSSTVCQVAPN